MKEDMSRKLRFVFFSKKYSMFAKYIELEGYDVSSLQKFDNVICQAFSMLKRNFLHKNTKTVYNPNLRNFDGTYIIFDSVIKVEDLIWLRKENPKARMVFCVWNPVSMLNIDIEKVRRLGYELWSYGKKQCNQYQLKETLYFYCPSMYTKALSLNNAPKHDIVFAGKDKGRLEKINQLINQNNWEKFDWKFYFIADHFWLRFTKKEYHKKLSYRETQVLQADSKAIMELLPASDVDVTMRTLDSLILKRKLITDAREIIERDYYHPNNVFVLGVDKAETLEEFLSKPYHPISDEILSRYSLDEWVKRIVEDRPINGEKNAV